MSDDFDSIHTHGEEGLTPISDLLETIRADTSHPNPNNIDRLLDRTVPMRRDVARLMEAPEIDTTPLREALVNQAMNDILKSDPNKLPQDADELRKALEERTAEIVTEQSEKSRTNPEVSYTERLSKKSTPGNTDVPPRQ